jgi:hypothetical protein
VERTAANISGRVEASGGSGLGCTTGLSTAAARRERDDRVKGKRKEEERCEVVT